MLLLCSLRGSIILYQGEELGLPQVDVPFELLQDPEAIANWPQTLSRDGARTPMPWSSSSKNLGFSTARPWLPIGDSHARLAVDEQEALDQSLLNFTRRCLEVRKLHPALRHGTMHVRHADASLLEFDREDAGRRLRCSFNLSASAVERAAVGTAIISVGDVTPDRLGPWSAVIENVE
jgi:alpha-glucosidase